LLRKAARRGFDQGKTKSPIFQAEQRFVNLSHLAIEKKELLEGSVRSCQLRCSKGKKKIFEN
jgi:hypothetical protein